LEWMAKRRKLKRILMVSPYSELRSIGFFDALRHQESKGTFTEIILAAEIDGYSIVCETERERRNSFCFTVFLWPRILDEQQLKVLKKKFAAHNIALHNGAARKWYSLRKPPVESILQLKKELKEYIVLLKDEGWESR
jgi:hypothetical protein